MVFSHENQQPNQCGKSPRHQRRRPPFLEQEAIVFFLNCFDQLLRCYSSKKKKKFTTLLFIDNISDLNFEISDDSNQCKIMINTGGIARSTLIPTDFATHKLLLKRKDIAINTEIITKKSSTWWYGKGFRVSNSNIVGALWPFFLLYSAMKLKDMYKRAYCGDTRNQRFNLIEFLIFVPRFLCNR